MSKTQSGLILIVAGVIMNVMGRLLIPVTRPNPHLLVAAFMALWMLASLVVVLFGIFRLIVALVSGSQRAKPKKDLAP